MHDPGNNPELTPLRERPIPEIADTLQHVLGQQITAFAIRERDPRCIGGISRSELVLTEESEVTIRDLAEVTEVLLEANGGSGEIVRSVMIGSNPSLNDRAPIELFHLGESSAVVLSAKQL